MQTYSGDGRGLFPRFALLAAILAVLAAPAQLSAEPPAGKVLPVVAAAKKTPQPLDEIDRFKILVDSKNLSDFEFVWRKYIQELYERETKRLPGAPPVASLPLGAEDGENWPVDRVVIDDPKGPRQLEGIIRGENEKELSFREIRRTPGKELSGQGYVFPLDTVLHREELSKEERAKLAKLILDYDHRKATETRSKKVLELGQRREDFKTLKTYRGSGFELESTADDDTIRTTIVRIDQRINAYQKLLPPRIPAPRRPLKILLLGSAAEYKKYLNDERLRVAGPALYLPEANLVVAYSEQEVLSKNWAEAAAKNRNTEQELKQEKIDLQQILARDSKALRELKFPPKDVRAQNLLRQAVAVAKIGETERKLKECERNNQRIREEEIDKLYRVLYHEIFHAYLESYVYDHKTHNVPRWLNEGLAQVVENGRLESGQLRIDAPDRERLTKLYDDLRRPDALSLVGLFGARPDAFLGIHGPEKRVANADRYYLYSWGLAYYLAFEKRRLGTKALDAFVTPVAAEPVQNVAEDPR